MSKSLGGGDDPNNPTGGARLPPDQSNESDDDEHPPSASNGDPAADNVARAPEGIENIAADQEPFDILQPGEMIDEGGISAEALAIELNELHGLDPTDEEMHHLFSLANTNSEHEVHVDPSPTGVEEAYDTQSNGIGADSGPHEASTDGATGSSRNEKQKEGSSASAPTAPAQKKKRGPQNCPVCGAKRAGHLCPKLKERVKDLLSRHPMKVSEKDKKRLRELVKKAIRQKKSEAATLQSADDTSTQAAGTNATEDPQSNNNVPTTGSRARGIGSYKCGRCGLPKKGHICPFDDRKPAAKPSPSADTEDNDHNPAAKSGSDQFETEPEAKIDDSSEASYDGKKREVDDPADISTEGDKPRKRRKSSDVAPEEQPGVATATVLGAEEPDTSNQEAETEEPPTAEHVGTQVSAEPVEELESSSPSVMAANPQEERRPRDILDDGPPKDDMSDDDTEEA